MHKDLWSSVFGHCNFCILNFEFHATDRSKAVVPVLFLFCVTLWFIPRGASCFKVFPCFLSSCFIIPFSIVITSLGEEGAGLCASRVFSCLFCTW